MIYIMNTKTFDKIFSKEDPKKIEKTQFIIASKRIRKSKEEDSVIFMRNLVPPDMLLADANSFIYFAGEKSATDFFEKEYKKHLDKFRLTLAIIIKGVVEENLTEMFMCTYKEWNIGYMRVLAEYIEEEFHYPVIDYRKYKLKKKLPRVLDFSREEVISICNKVIRKEMKKQRKEKMKTKEGTLEIIRNMSKDEMRRELKRLNLYSPELDKQTMRELLEDFLV